VTILNIGVRYISFSGKILLTLCFLSFTFSSFSQDQAKDTDQKKLADSAASTAHMRKQRDLIDILLMIIGKDPGFRLDSNLKSQSGRLHISGAPSPSYSLATSFGFNVTANTAFYAGDKNVTNLSSVLISPLYTFNQQFALPIQFSIWLKNNKYLIVGDWRFLRYPEDTYGIGGLSYEGDTVKVNYDYIRVYSFLLKTIATNFYAGIGYEIDNHWNIEQTNVPANTQTVIDKYGYTHSSVSSGPAIDLLYDSRKNSINPEAGSTYANVVLRQNFTALGSNGNWGSLLIDLRKFFRLNDHTNNILAIWSYNWLTTNGKAPYLDLPSTGWDTYGNTGRGYVQSRFRSPNMVDLEAEYRFGVLNNGLIGWVVFGNVQSFSEYPSNRFEALQPGIGTGIRIKFNKFSKTNLCFDWGWGLHGSNGAFVNLGEVF